MTNQDKKKCSKCGKVKDLNKFYAVGNRKRAACKSCTRKAQRKYYKVKEEIKRELPKEEKLSEHYQKTGVIRLTRDKFKHGKNLMLKQVQEILDRIL